MKKLVYLSTAALLALAACTKDNVIEKEEAPGINFSTLTESAITRSDVVSTSTPNSAFLQDGRTFYVIGEYNNGHSGADAFNMTATATYNLSSTSWGLTTDRNWPGSALDFFAASPSDAQTQTMTAAQATKKVTLNNYTVNTNIVKQTDLMFAGALNQTYKATNTTTKGTTNLNFYHALSQIVFKATASTSTLGVGNQKVKVDITSVELGNVNSKADVSVLIAGDNSTGFTATPTWSNWSTLVVYTVTPATTVTVSSDDPEGSKVKDITQYGTSEGIEGADGSVDNELLLIPQTLSSWAIGDEEGQINIDDDSNIFTSGTNAYIKVNCTLTIGDDVIVGPSEEIKAIYIPFNTSVTVGETTTTAWEAGKKYIYTLDFSGAGKDEHGNPLLNKIKFTASVEDWVNVTPGSNISL